MQNNSMQIELPPNLLEGTIKEFRNVRTLSVETDIIPNKREGPTLLYRIPVDSI